LKAPRGAQVNCQIDRSQCGKSFHLIERRAQLLDLHDKKGLANHYSSAVEPALQNMAFAEQSTAKQNVHSGGNLGRQPCRLAHIGSRFVEGAAAELDAAQILKSPEGDLWVRRVLPRAHHF